MGVDEIGAHELGADETGIDETDADEMVLLPEVRGSRWTQKIGHESW
jgi:hypothetical protein